MKNDSVLLKTDFTGLKLFRRGKVRDVYDLGEHLLFVATDRISCFDVVLADGIPGKGEVLTAMSLFWFNVLTDIVPNHFVTADVSAYPAQLAAYRKDLEGRSMLVRKTSPLPIECVVRGYLSGSGWKEYSAKGTVCSIPLPAGLSESSKLPEPLFTPSTKEDVGHDINVSPRYVEEKLGARLAGKLSEISRALYVKAAELAFKKGIIIADTKFEFGTSGGELVLIDEVLTPDSSRFWPVDSYTPGKPQPSFDKQFVRDYLESVSWNKKPPAPRLPAQIIEKTVQKYREALKQLTGNDLLCRK